MKQFHINIKIKRKIKINIKNRLFLMNKVINLFKKRMR